MWRDCVETDGGGDWPQQVHESADTQCIYLYFDCDAVYVNMLAFLLISQDAQPQSATAESQAMLTAGN